MPSLEVLQTEIRSAIVSGHLALAARAIDGDGLAPDRRLAIHRHHFLHTLVEALGVTYPVTRRLLGDGAFTAAAEGFIQMSPPDGPCLFEYGREFAAYLAAHPTMEALAYLGDVCRFEWAINRAYHAPDGDAPPPPDTSARRSGELIAAVAPHVGLVESPYPIAAIWTAHQEDPVPEVDLDQGGCRLAVFRRRLDVLWRPLGPGEAALLAALRAERPLALAFARALDAEPGFDPSSALAAFAGEGLVLGFHLSKPFEEPSP